MIKTLGEAAFSLALAASGLSPFYIGGWPEAPESAGDSSYEAQVIPAPDAAPLAAKPDSSEIPDLYSEISEQRIAEQKIKADIDKLAANIRSAFGINPTRAKNFSEWIIDAVESTSIPKEVMTALVVSESSFQYKLRSSVGAVGPAQVRPVFWAEKCGSGDLENDPKFNIQCGVTALSEYLEKECDGDMTCALQTYNVGPSNMDLPEYEGAKQRYISKINRNMAKLTGRTVLARN